MPFDEIINDFDFDIVSDAMDGYADAVYISKERSERYDAIVGYAILGEHNGLPGTHLTLDSVLRRIDIIQSTRRLFDLYDCPASLAPNINSDDMVKIFDKGIKANETELVLPFNDDIMNIDILMMTYVAGCMLERKMIDRNMMMSCINVQERATDDSNRHHRIFWRHVLSTLDDEMLATFLKSNIPMLQNFATTSPLVAYPYDDEQKAIIDRYVRRYAKKPTFSYLKGNPFGNW